MIINFKIRKINQGVHKQTLTSTLIFLKIILMKRIKKQAKSRVLF